MTGRWRSRLGWVGSVWCRSGLGGEFSLEHFVELSGHGLFGFYDVVGAEAGGAAIQPRPPTTQLHRRPAENRRRRGHDPGVRSSDRVGPDRRRLDPLGHRVRLGPAGSWSIVKGSGTRVSLRLTPGTTARRSPPVPPVQRFGAAEHPGIVAHSRVRWSRWGDSLRTARAVWRAQDRFRQSRNRRGRPLSAVVSHAACLRRTPRLHSRLT